MIEEGLERHITNTNIIKKRIFYQFTYYILYIYIYGWTYRDVALINVWISLSIRCDIENKFKYHGIEQLVFIFIFYHHIIKYTQQFQYRIAKRFIYFIIIFSISLLFY